MTVHDLMPFLLLGMSLVVSLIGWVVRDAMKRIDALLLQSTEHGTKIALLTESGMRERVDDHEARLRTLELGLQEIRTDVKIIRNILEKDSKNHGR